MDLDLSRFEYDLIKTSLEFTRQAYEKYDGYPSKQFKIDQIHRVEELSSKLTEWYWNGKPPRGRQCHKQS